MNRRLTSLVLLVLAGAAVSCAGLKGSDSPTGTGTGGTGAVPIPIRPCSSDGQCPTGSACFTNQCVARRTNISDLSIEILPPTGSGSQVTEIPSAGAATVLKADAAFSLVIGFGPPAAVPANAAVILTVPSRIAGRPNLSFQANLLPGPPATATLELPESIRGQQAALTLLPTSPSDQAKPPYRTTVVVPTTRDDLAIILPADQQLVYGHLRDALGMPKMGYTARAFQQGALVSSNGSTAANAAVGDFTISLPASATTDIALELVPQNASDPWVTFNAPLSLVPPSTDLGTIELPAFLVADMFRLPVYASDSLKSPVAGASVRAYTKIEGGDPRTSTRYLRDATTDAMGGGSLYLIPGDTRAPRSYTISVVPAPGSEWASQCVNDVAVEKYVSALPEVMLVRRPMISGVVVSASGAPVANLLINATLMPISNSPCLPGPSTTSVSTDAKGSYELRLDPGSYQLDYVPPAGSAIPRMSADLAVESTGPRSVAMPAPALIEGDLQDSGNGLLPSTTIRFFETRCSGNGCRAPLLRAETQTDTNGHFRAIVIAPPGTY